MGWSVHLLTSRSGRHPAIVTSLFLCVEVELFHPCGFDWITQELLISKLSVLLLEYQLHINLFFILKRYFFLATLLFSLTQRRATQLSNLFFIEIIKSTGS